MEQHLMCASRLSCFAVYLHFNGRITENATTIFGKFGTVQIFLDNVIAVLMQNECKHIKCIVSKSCHYE